MRSGRFIFGWTAPAPHSHFVGAAAAQPESLARQAGRCMRRKAVHYRLPTVTTKDLLKETAAQLPENASVEDAMERLLFLAKIERGKADAQAGRLVSHEDVKGRLGL